MSLAKLCMVKPYLHACWWDMRLFLSVLVVLCSAVVVPVTSAKTVHVVVGWNKPPYVISETDSGFELELTRQILQTLGHDMQPVYVPFGRTMTMVEDGNVDIVLTVNAGHAVERHLLTAPYVTYQNVAVTLKARQLAIGSLSDMEGHSVIAFQTAANVLGADYANAVKSASGYLEMPEQQRQVTMLLLGSVDIAVIDRNIFMYFKHKLPATYQHATVLHELFGISAYSAAIRDPVLRGQFDRELQAMKGDGRYEALLEEFGLVNLLHRLPASQYQLPDVTN